MAFTQKRLLIYRFLLPGLFLLIQLFASLPASGRTERPLSQSDEIQRLPDEDTIRKEPAKILDAQRGPADGFSANADKPDERILWDLVHQGKNQRSEEIIDQWRRKYPGWQPPPELIKALTDGLLKDGDYDGALSLAKEYGLDDSAIRQQAGGRLVALAWENYRLQEYDKSRDQANRALFYLDHSFEVDTLLAWLDYQDKNYRQALERFEKLYARKPDPSLANGILACQMALGADFETLSRLAKKYPADFGPAINRIMRDQLYWHREFLASYRLAVTAGPTPKNEKQESSSAAKAESDQTMFRLTNIDSPAAGTFALYRDKRGDAGTSALTIAVLPAVKTTFVSNDIHSVGLTAYRWHLDSGTVEPWGTPVGSAGVYQGGDRSLAAPFDVGLEEGWGLSAEYQRSGWWHPYVRLGLTPTNGEIDPTVSGQLGINRQIKTGSWRLEFFSLPVKDSVLSFTGMHDPYSDRSWGRVTKNGVLAGMYYSLNRHWGVYGEAEGAWLDGKEVKENQMIRLAASLGYNVRLTGFDYLTIGPQLNFSHYENNSDHYTLGHGGYFSPDRYYNAGLGLNFLTEEGKPLMVRGHAGIGYQSIDNAAAELFPDQPELAGQSILLAGGGLLTSYEASSSRGISYDVEFVGSKLLTLRWQLNGGAGLRKNKGYEDYFVGIGLRFFFKPRNALFSTDIPREMFESVL